MAKPLPSEIAGPRNAEILRALGGQSCHGDIIWPMKRCLIGLVGVESYCPEPENFSYVLWFVDGVVFACATGMKKVSLRLSEADALQDEVKSSGCVGVEGWYDVPWNFSRLELLVLNAYDLARNS